MSTEENKEAVRRMLDALQGGNGDAMAKLVAANWENHDPSMPPMKGIQGARQLATVLHTAFPDAQVTADKVIAEGDRVGAHFTFSGTHRGNFLDVPPTGKRVNIEAAGVFRVVDGKVTDNWVNFDAMTLMQQLGLAPTP